ncbi:hypothetical protein M407DRAFT_25289 [Tulasnella calospora MUT 4182]|uniref:Uncharacterized protein n=1 Tax=Tulasnella calospora MUT 4182 TaxID=1051891 RepID=A0A0C3KVD2_9AGAM|nr:hypothetical protein M407DRAFT_25289 [Tulasnella calospora MUT 4182]
MSADRHKPLRTPPQTWSSSNHYHPIRKRTDIMMTYVLMSALTLVLSLDSASFALPGQRGAPGRLKRRSEGFLCWKENTACGKGRPRYWSNRASVHHLSRAYGLALHTQWVVAPDNAEDTRGSVKAIRRWCFLRFNGTRSPSRAPPHGGPGHRRSTHAASTKLQYLPPFSIMIKPADECSPSCFVLILSRLHEQILPLDWKEYTA